MSHPSNFVSTAPTITVTPAKVLEQNTARNGLLLYNQGANDVYVYLDTAAAFFKIATGERKEFNIPPMNEVWAYTLASTAVLTVIEF